MNAPAGRTRARQSGRIHVAAALVALAATATTQAADRLAPLLACRALADEATRLACFDRESARLGGPAVAAALSPEQKFGLGAATVATQEAARGQPRADLDALEAKLAALNAGADGRLVFALDNGQVWRQLVPGPDLLLKVGDPVKIERGALGSFWLVAPAGRRCKVTRVR